MSTTSSFADQMHRITVLQQVLNGLEKLPTEDDSIASEQSPEHPQPGLPQRHSR